MNVNSIKQVACIGGGVIGSSWAIQFAMKGLDVTLYDINEEQLKKSSDQMHKSLEALVQYNAITAQQCAELVARVNLTTSIEEAVRGAQFIQESGPERLEIKQSILAQVEESAAEDAIYASSTSGLLISDIAAKAAHPERCVGAHPLQSPSPDPPWWSSPPVRRPILRFFRLPMTFISPLARRQSSCARSALASLPTGFSWPSTVRCRIW